MRAFVIAMECEAECVRPHLKPGDRLYVSGIGKVNAAAATQRAICEGADEIWNAGLCGGFGGDIEVGDVFGVESAVEYDFDLAKLNGTRVGQLDEYETPYLEMARVDGPRSFSLTSGGDAASPMNKEFAVSLTSGGDAASPVNKEFAVSLTSGEDAASPMAFSCGSEKLQYRILATGDRFNDGESDYALITRELGASLRDMEGAAIAHVCRLNGVKCVSVKCVTNVAGKGSMTGQYETNRRRCLERLSTAMKELM